MNGTRARHSSACCGWRRHPFQARMRPVIDRLLPHASVPHEYPLSRGTKYDSPRVGNCKCDSKGISVIVDKTCLIQNIKFGILHPLLAPELFNQEINHHQKSPIHCSKKSKWASHRSFPSGKRPTVASPLGRSSLAMSSGTSNSSLTRRTATSTTVCPSSVIPTARC